MTFFLEIQSERRAALEIEAADPAVELSQAATLPTLPHPHEAKLNFISSFTRLASVRAACNTPSLLYTTILIIAFTDPIVLMNCTAPQNFRTPSRW